VAQYFGHNIRRYQVHLLTVYKLSIVFTVVRIFFLVASLCNSVSGLLLQIPSSVSVRYVYQSVLPLVTIVSSREMAYSIELPFGGSGSGGGSSESCAHWPAPPGTYG